MKTHTHTCVCIYIYICIHSPLGLSVLVSSLMDGESPEAYSRIWAHTTEQPMDGESPEIYKRIWAHTTEQLMDGESPEVYQRCPGRSGADVVLRATTKTMGCGEASKLEESGPRGAQGGLEQMSYYGWLLK